MQTNRNDTPTPKNGWYLDKSKNQIAFHLFMDFKKSAETESNSLRELGYSPDMIERINAMSIEDIEEISRHCDRFFSMNIDESRFMQVHKKLEISKSERDLINELIIAQAPYRFLSECFGLTTNDIAIHRKQLRLEAQTAGRSKSPTEAEERKIFKVAQNTLPKLDQRSSYFYPRLVLAVYKETEIEFSKIVQVLTENTVDSLI